MRKFSQPLSQYAFQGQGGLIAVAITIVIALVIGSTTLSGLSMMNAKRSIATKQTLQTYYTAEAGLQEAVATRMLPRSNYLNFLGSTNQFYSRSGRIYQNPSSTSQGLVGIYRYMIVGGDAARQSNGNYYATNSNTPTGIPRLLAVDTFPEDSPFMIISNGLTCKPTNKDATVAVDRFILSNSLQPTCQSGYTLDEITLVAKVRVAQEPSNGSRVYDKVERVRTFKDRTRLRMPANGFVPGYGWTNSGTEISFDRMWTYNETSDPTPANNPLKLERVVFYNFTDNSIYVDHAVNATSSNIASAVPSNAAIRLYFNGPIDYRSISPSFDKTLTDCKPQPPSSPNQQDNCNVRVVPNPPLTAVNHAYAGNTIIPLFPGSTQVILLPPLTNTLSSGTPHQLEIDTTQMRNYNNVKGLSNYRVTFTTE